MMLQGDEIQEAKFGLDEEEYLSYGSKELEDIMELDALSFKVSLDINQTLNEIIVSLAIMDIVQKIVTEQLICLEHTVVTV